MNVARRMVPLVAAAAAVLIVASAGASAAPKGGGRPPTDYLEVAGLSQPDYPKTVQQELHVPVGDGIELYVEVTMPDAAEYPDAGPWPVIMEASPYHGTIADREGIRIFPDPVDENGNPIGLTGYFAPRGYAVAIVDLRGTGRSSGCLDHLGPNDARDLKAIVEWAASQPWSNGRVGMVGHSYVGSTPSLAAAQNPRGLVTIVPSAGLASMYDHQFQAGVPYFLQWAGPQWSYASLSTLRHLPPQASPATNLALGASGDDFGNHVTETGCGWRTSALTSGDGQVTGQYKQWHADRDWRAEAAAARMPVFMVHGVNDNAARIPAAEWFFADRSNKRDKVWLGQWDHGSGAHVNRRYTQWQMALHAWLDKHLQQRDVDTGPPVEVFLNDGRVYTSSRWAPLAGDVNLYPDARDGSLSFSPPSGDGQASFLAAANWTRDNRVRFVSDPVTRERLILGLPELDLDASTTTSQISHLVTTLYREDQFGFRHPMTYCTIQPMLRNGVDTVTPVVPGERMELEPQCFTMAHLVEPGDRLVLEVGTRSPHHVPTPFAVDGRVTVYTGDDGTAFTGSSTQQPRLHRDVPLFDDASLREGPAQQTLQRTINVTAPGGGALGFVTPPFAIEGGHRKVEVVAQQRESANIIVLLQRLVNGTWTTFASSNTIGFDPVRFEGVRPPAGDYRLFVSNRAGQPMLPVDATVTFLNRYGEPGPDQELPAQG